MKVDLDSALGRLRSETIKKASDETASMSERIHALRVGCKKLKAVLRLEGGQRSLRTSIGEIQRSLATFRELDVEARLHHRPKPSDQSPAARRALEEAVARLSVLDLGEHGRLKTRKALDRSWSRAGACAEVAAGEANDAAAGRARTTLHDKRDLCFHEFRKRVKDLQYQLGALGIKRGRQRRLREISEALGDAHDLAVLNRRPRARTALYRRALAEWEKI